MFELRFTSRAIKDMKKLPRLISKRILEMIQNFEENPFNENLKKLAGQPYFRIRIGDYRVILDIKKKELIILIIKVTHRKHIYR